MSKDSDSRGTMSHSETVVSGILKTAIDAKDLDVLFLLLVNEVRYDTAKEHISIPFKFDELISSIKNKILRRNNINIPRKINTHNNTIAEQTAQEYIKGLGYLLHTPYLLEGTKTYAHYESQILALPKGHPVKDIIGFWLDPTSDNDSDYKTLLLRLLNPDLFKQYAANNDDNKNNILSYMTTGGDILYRIYNDIVIIEETNEIKGKLRKICASEKIFIEKVNTSLPSIVSNEANSSNVQKILLLTGELSRLVDESSIRSGATIEEINEKLTVISKQKEKIEKAISAFNLEQKASILLSQIRNSLTFSHKEKISTTAQLEELIRDLEPSAVTDPRYSEISSIYASWQEEKNRKEEAGEFAPSVFASFLSYFINSEPTETIASDSTTACEINIDTKSKKGQSIEIKISKIIREKVYYGTCEANYQSTQDEKNLKVARVIDQLTLSQTALYDQRTFVINSYHEFEAIYKVSQELLSSLRITIETKDITQTAKKKYTKLADTLEKKLKEKFSSTKAAKIKVIKKAFNNQQEAQKSIGNHEQKAIGNHEQKPNLTPNNNQEKIEKIIKSIKSGKFSSTELYTLLVSSQDIFAYSKIKSKPHETRVQETTIFNCILEESIKSRVFPYAYITTFISFFPRFNDWLIEIQEHPNQPEQGQKFTPTQQGRIKQMHTCFQGLLRSLGDIILDSSMHLRMDSIGLTGSKFFKFFKFSKLNETLPAEVMTLFLMENNSSIGKQITEYFFSIIDGSNKATITELLQAHKIRAVEDKITKTEELIQQWQELREQNLRDHQPRQALDDKQNLDPNRTTVITKIQIDASNTHRELEKTNVLIGKSFIDIAEISKRIQAKNRLIKAKHTDLSASKKTPEQAKVQHQSLSAR